LDQKAFGTGHEVAASHVYLYPFPGQLRDHVVNSSLTHTEAQVS
jgi:hypothetical protein